MPTEKNPWSEFIPYTRFFVSEYALLICPEPNTRYLFAAFCVGERSNKMDFGDFSISKSGRGGESNPSIKA